VIRLEDVAARAGDFRLAGISLEIPAGGYGLVIGPTGAGKTTLLEAIAGHASLEAGRVFLRDRDVTQVKPEDRAVGFVYQRYHLFPHLSVEDNIRYGIASGPLDRIQQRHRVAELAEALGLTPLLRRGVGDLSGGESQRVALARALAPRPTILLLDEPFASLDPTTRHLLRRELLELHRRERVTTLQVTHDFQEALRLGDVVAVMAEGKIVQRGTPEEVFRYPNSAFVARFIGAANVIAGTVSRTVGGDVDGPRFAARFDSGPLTLEVIAEREGPLNAVIQPEDLVLSRAPQSGSARNRILATVTGLETVGPVTNVFLDAGHPLVAAITTVSAKAMGLARGEAVHVTLKATAVHLV